MQSFVLDPACHAGAHVCVGIAGPHIHSRTLSASEKASSPARYRAIRLIWDLFDDNLPESERKRQLVQVQKNIAHRALNSYFHKPVHEAQSKGG